MQKKTWKSVHYFITSFLRSEKSKPFKLDIADVAILRALADYMDMSPKRECSVSQKTLARELNISPRWLRPRLQILAQKGLISIKRKWKMYKYYIGEALLIIDLSEAKEPVDKIVEKVQKVVSGDVTSGDQGTMRPLTIEEERKIKKKIIYNVHSEKISEKRFDDFWNAYPRKQGGKKALREKWAKRNLDAIADQIIAHVEAMKQNDWLGKEEEYIPMASTYLNQDRWEDEILRRETHETDRRNSQLTRRQASVQSHLDFLESLDPCSGESFIKH